MKIVLLVLFVILLGCNSSHKLEHKPWDNGQVIVSQDGRFFQHENGEPFFWLADTGWLLFRTLNREQAEHYLENRRQLGFNVIQVMVVHEFPMLNFYGDSAFVDQNVAFPKVTPGQNPDDPQQYDFWDHVDYIIKTAENKGLYMALVPVWGSNVRGGQVYEKDAAVYAAWLATRYKDAPNIFWLNGGDVKGSDNTNVWQSVGRTIKKIAPNHLMTFHPFGRTQSSTWFHDEAWLDFNMFQSGHRRYDQGDGEENWKGEDNWRYVKEDYAKTPVKPTLDGEPSYENIPQGLHDPSEPYWQAQDVRRYAYWSVFAGACGHTYGHNAVMQMYNPNSTKASYGVKEFWYDAINSPGAQQMQFVKKLVLSRPYFERVPDQSVVAGDAGTKYDYVMATRGNSYVFVYTYTGRNFEINLGRISGEQVRAWWYNPRDGEATEIGVFMNSGTLSFDPPGDKQEGNDWILVLDDARAKYPAPGLI